MDVCPGVETVEDRSTGNICHFNQSNIYVYKNVAVSKKCIIEFSHKNKTFNLSFYDAGSFECGG